MINIRLELNERLKEFGGHIGYSIRPAERKKGYNKINLYLGLQVCKDHNIDTVFLDADVDNPGSWKTMEAVGGNLMKQWKNPKDNKDVKIYAIDVNKSLEEYKDLYKPYIKEGIKNEGSSIQSR